MEWATEERELNFRQKQGIFVFHKDSIRAPESTQSTLSSGVKRSGHNAEHPAANIKRLTRALSRFWLHREVLGFAAGYNVGSQTLHSILRVFSGHSFLSNNRFLFCSYVHLMLETSIDNCEATCALRTDQPVE
jgi:hypothetical protein